MSVLGANGPTPLPSNTETLLAPLLAVTRSCRPSPLKSPTAPDCGVDATVEFNAVNRVPEPVPFSTEVFDEPLFAVTIS